MNVINIVGSLTKQGPTKLTLSTSGSNPDPWALRPSQKTGHARADDEPPGHGNNQSCVKLLKNSVGRSAPMAEMFSLQQTVNSTCTHSWHNSHYTKDNTSQESFEVGCMNPCMNLMRTNMSNHAPLPRRAEEASLSLDHPTP